MAASDMRNRRHVQLLLTWSTNAAHPGLEALTGYYHMGPGFLWQTDLAPKEMAPSDMKNRHHVQLLLSWSKNAAHPVSLD
ncbi:hypothetical protein LAZ67_15003269 [Cordylochernes scorpioides]|uniref:Uncharacterized protein n=1 Tax=Cordylochernes scorpioides TaxID=51811 RepID=A0ABY6LA61_9ARAC|nr:hypothetical protein LAZ67_15003269 [Cordylochernes scorpioides]